MLRSNVIVVSFLFFFISHFSLSEAAFNVCLSACPCLSSYILCLKLRQKLSKISHIKTVSFWCVLIFTHSLSCSLTLPPAPHNTSSLILSLLTLPSTLYPVTLLLHLTLCSLTLSSLHPSHSIPCPLTPLTFAPSPIVSLHPSPVHSHPAHPPPPTLPLCL